MIRILIVDDHKLYREGLRLQLEAHGGFVVVGEASDAESGLDQALRLKPDIVFMDIEMPGISCFETIRRIHESLSGTKVVVLSGHMEDESIAQAVRAQARGYVVKEDGFDQVRDAIREVLAGKLYYTQAVLDRVETRNGRLRLGEQVSTRLETLTPRERELLVLLGQGYSLKEACRALRVTYKTADKHKVNLMKKLDIHDRVELARFAIREKIIQP